MRKLVALAAAVVIAAMIGALWYVTGPGVGGDRFAECRSTRVAGGLDLGGPFTLVGADGETVESTALLETPALLYFGYTFCPDVCPVDAARNAQAIDILQSRDVTATPVFITVDPQRDTPRVVGEFAAALHPEMIGLTGSPEAVKAAADAYRVYARVPESADPYYLVDHTAFSYLTLPGEGVVEVFGRDVSAEALADTAACFIAAAA